MQYNTSRTLMPIKEYGRSVHNMVQHLMTIEDKEKRQKNAEAVIEVMAILNPQLKNQEDYQHKLWDHLFLMSDYKLDVECPYPIPTKEVKQQKPAPLRYPKQKIRWNHLGKSFEKLYEKAIQETDAEKKQGYVHILALFMKVAYTNWHKEAMPEDMIREELLNLSKGALEYDPTSKFSEWVDTGSLATIHASQKNNYKKAFFTKNNRGNNRYGNNNNNMGAGLGNKKFHRYKKKK